MGIINSDDFMTFEEKDKFWALLFDRISKAVLEDHSFTVVFGLNEVVGGDYEKADDYSLIVEKDQFESFLTNYIQWCEDLERFEQCQKALEVLNTFKSQDSKSE